MKPPRVYPRGILLPSFGEIRRSTLLRLPCGVLALVEIIDLGRAVTPRGEPSFGGSTIRIRPRDYARDPLRRRIIKGRGMVPALVFSALPSLYFCLQ